MSPSPPSEFGRNKKVLALDLDNTLWGGVIGDDGQDGIEIGEETAAGETFKAFQAYVRKHKDIGVLLSVDSKNEPENAMLGLNHPQGVLKPDDFVLIHAQVWVCERASAHASRGNTPFGTEYHH